MERRIVCTAAVSILIPVLSASAADPEPPSLQHEQGVCVAPGAWPRIDARVEGIRAHVVFHAKGSPDWYSVAMRSADGVWSATLPRPTKHTTGFAYFLLAEGPGGQARLPAKSAFFVSVSDDCRGTALPIGDGGPDLLGLVGDSPRHTPDFDTTSVEGFIKRTSIEIPLSLQDWTPSSPCRVRIRTLAENRWLEGALQSADDDAFVISSRNEGPIRVRRHDVVAFEWRKPGSAGMALVGGVVGTLAGSFATFLACGGIKEAGMEMCGVEVLVGGMTLGAIGGAAIAGSGRWQPVPVLGTARVALSAQPMARGGAVGIRVGF